MLPIPQQAMTRVPIQGPFWIAEVDVLEFVSPQKNWAFRTLFLDNTPRSRLSEDQLYLPGTLLLLSFVRQVEIRPAPDYFYVWKQDNQETPLAVQTPEQIREALTTGNLSLLLVQADPETWPTREPKRDDRAFFPPLTCLAGEIALDGFLQPQSDANTELYRALNLEMVSIPLDREGATHLLSSISAHSSGLSIYGAIAIPWQSDRIASPFQLAKQLPDLSEGDRQFRLTLEQERLTPIEQAQWQSTWNRFSRYLNPRNPLNGSLLLPDALTPNWVTLEVTDPKAIPNLHWQIAPWTAAASPRLQFSTDSLSLIFSDQSPYDTDNPPTSIGRIRPNTISVSQSEEDLVVQVEAGATPDSESTDAKLRYQYQTPAASENEIQNSDRRQEFVTLENLHLAFDPVETPRFLREQQDLPTPTRPNEDRPAEPSLLWGFMPLEIGWAQLPIPNLTEQIYLDSGIAQLPQTSADDLQPSTLLRGAVSLGNDRIELLTNDYPNEQPWNFVLTNVRRLEGTWTLEPLSDGNGSTDGYRLVRVELMGWTPEVTLNGVFWLNTDRPTVEDGIPGLDNWISGLRSLSLRTVNPETDLFPAPIVLNLESLNFFARSLPSTPSNPKPISACLGAWTFTYEAEAKVFNEMVEKKVLPSNTFSQFLSWVWQRHPLLPMVQALPLTQSQNPPNYPSTSRQLLPFELGVTTEADGQPGLPKNWRFGIVGDNGATCWSQPVGDPP